MKVFKKQGSNNGKIKVTVEFNTDYVREMLTLYKDVAIPVLGVLGADAELIKQLKEIDIRETQ